MLWSYDYCVYKVIVCRWDDVASFIISGCTSIVMALFMAWCQGYPVRVRFFHIVELWFGVCKVLDCRLDDVISFIVPGCTVNSTICENPNPNPRPWDTPGMNKV